MSLLTQALVAEKYGIRIDIEQLAEIMRMKKGTVYNQLSAGTFPVPTYNEGKKRFAHYRDVAAYLDSRANEEAPGSDEFIHNGPELDDSHREGRIFTQVLVAEKYGLRVGIDSLADLFNISRGALYNQISAGTFPIATYIEGKGRFADYRDVAAHLDRCREKARKGMS